MVINVVTNTEYGRLILSIAGASLERNSQTKRCSYFVATVQLTH